VIGNRNEIIFDIFVRVLSFEIRSQRTHLPLIFLFITNVLLIHMTHLYAFSFRLQAHPDGVLQKLWCRSYRPILCGVRY
jgi:hypothetical protein